MIGSLLTLMEGRVETASRFPGWRLHFSYDWLRGDLRLAAVRVSDGRRLDYSEPLTSERNADVRAALHRMLDRLGAEFLDLVPIDPPHSEIPSR